MKKILILLLIIAVGAFAWWRYYTTTPKYSLLQARGAVEAHNAAEFDKYVDVASVTSHLLDELTAQRSLLSLVNPGSWLAKGIAGLAKSGLSAGAKQQVDTFVSTGSIEQARKEGGRFSLAGLVGKVVSDSSEFKGIAYENVLSNGTAEVGMEFTQPRYDTTFVVSLRMADRGDHWQVTEIVRPGDILRHVSRMEKQRLINKLTN